jgi:siroheme synthase
MPAHNWRELAESGGTLAVYMGARTLRRVADALLDAGMAAGTPAAAVESASQPEERRILGTLGTIAGAVAAARVEGPTLVLIGPVVAFAGAAAGPASAAGRHAA